MFITEIRSGISDEQVSVLLTIWIKRAEKQNKNVTSCMAICCLVSSLDHGHRLWHEHWAILRRSCLLLMGFLIADSNEERWIFQLPTSYHIWILDSL